MAKKNYYLIRKKYRLTNRKPTYYVRFRDADGSLLPWRSTGETSKTRAELWAQAHLGEAVRQRDRFLPPVRSGPCVLFDTLRNLSYYLPSKNVAHRTISCLRSEKCVTIVDNR